MEDDIFLDWARMWIHYAPLGVVDTGRARAILEKQIGAKVSWCRSHVVWMLANPGQVVPHGHVFIHLDDNSSNDHPSNLLLLPKYKAASKSIRDWWRKNAHRKRVVYSRD